MEFGLSSCKETSNMSARRAEQVRERLKDVDPLVSETLDGILAACDSGASTFATSVESDFVKGTLVRTEGDGHKIQGVVGGLKIQGRGQHGFANDR